MKVLRNRNSNNSLFWYMAYTPFFMPLGFQEYFPIYKKICVVFMLISAVLFFYMLLKNQKTVLKIGNSNKIMFSILVYHIVLLLLTLLNQGGINEGLKKIFMAPIFCYLLYYGLKNSCQTAMTTLSNIIITVLTLNITIFNALFWKSYFSVDSHLIFLGHVQIVSQICVLGLLISWYLKAHYGLVKKANILLFVSVLNLIYSGTVASLIVLALMIVFVINKKVSKRLISRKSKAGFFFFSILVISVLFMFLPDMLNGKWIVNGVNITMSGRFFIWQEGIRLAKERIVAGYGAYGVLIKVFWNAWVGRENGANYAHSMILQSMLDGGIILTSTFVYMLYTGFKSANREKSLVIKYWYNAFYIIFMIIGLIESVQEYVFFFAFIIVFAMLPYYSERELSYSKVQGQSLYMNKIFKETIV